MSIFKIKPPFTKGESSPLKRGEAVCIKSGVLLLIPIDDVTGGKVAEITLKPTKLQKNINYNFYES